MFFVVVKLLEQSLWGEGAVTLYRFLQNLLARGIPARRHRENWSNFGHEDTHRKKNLNHIYSRLKIINDLVHKKTMEYTYNV